MMPRSMKSMIRAQTDFDRMRAHADTVLSSGGMRDFPRWFQILHGRMSGRLEEGTHRAPFCIFCREAHLTAEPLRSDVLTLENRGAEGFSIRGGVFN
jgi:hypothetical protein